MTESNQELKTSEEWSKHPEFDEIIIYDPDGWDRTNYQYSWHEEKITKQEYNNRMIQSTILSTTDIADKKIEEILKKRVANSVEVEYLIGKINYLRETIKSLRKTIKTLYNEKV